MVSKKLHYVSLLFRRPEDNPEIQNINSYADVPFVYLVNAFGKWFLEKTSGYNYVVHSIEYDGQGIPTSLKDIKFIENLTYNTVKDYDKHQVFITFLDGDMIPEVYFRENESVIMNVGRRYGILKDDDFVSVSTIKESDWDLTDIFESI